ncbi:MAG: aggregation factor core protein MAFp3, isoform C, partial [Pseudomonadota bacterium]
MKFRHHATLGVFALAIASPAAADLSIRFIEGAPKDRFSFENTGTCAIQDAVLTLDLSGSAAGLIFDVTAEGAGVEVFQPLEFVSGLDALSAVPEVQDGQNSVSIDVATL